MYALPVICTGNNNQCPHDHSKYSNYVDWHGDNEVIAWKRILGNNELTEVLLGDCF